MSGNLKSPSESIRPKKMKKEINSTLNDSDPSYSRVKRSVPKFKTGRRTQVMNPALDVPQNRQLLKLLINFIARLEYRRLNLFEIVGAANISKNLYFELSQGLCKIVAAFVDT